MRLHIRAFALTLSLAVAGLALANDVERPREVLSGGASDSTAGGVSLRATLGQPVVGVVSGSGTGSAGDVALAQGFWRGTNPAYNTHLPLVTRD